MGFIISEYEKNRLHLSEVDAKKNKVIKMSVKVTKENL